MLKYTIVLLSIARVYANLYPIYLLKVFIIYSIIIGITRGGTAIAISSSGSWFIRICRCLLKEKERGSKGRAIYRAVGS
jgi:hypothetical protein